MTKEEAIKELKACEEYGKGQGCCSADPHSMADDILCQFLRSLGHSDVADAYEAVEPKWYE